MSNIIDLRSSLRRFGDSLRKAEKSSATVGKYLRDAKHFLLYLDGGQITKERTVAYKRYLQEQGYRVSSVNSMLASVNAFLTFLGMSQCRVKFVRTQRKVYTPAEKELTKDEYMRLLEASSANRKLNLVLQTICGTGIRISELRYFTVEAVQTGEINVYCKNKTRTILLPGLLRKRLLKYAKDRNLSTGAIFVTRSGKPMDRSNIWTQMKRLCAAANVDPGKVFPHNLRKLFARCFYGISRDIAKLADVLGHGSIETTRIYIMTTGREHRRQLEQLHLII